MTQQEVVIQGLGLTVVGAPLALLVLLGFWSLVGHPLAERTIHRAVQAAIVTGLLASVAILGIMLSLDVRVIPIELGNWVVVPPHEYHFSIKFVFDRLSVPFVILSFALCGTVGAFATRYMHREPGFNRFFTFLSMFAAGMVITSLAGTIETLFAGWELVGLSSALLVAFFHERPAPVRNGLRVWIVYRVSDAALLVAALAMHHLKGEGDFYKLLGDSPWPNGVAQVTAHQALVVGLLLLLAAAGKSALVPFSGWLPRAMEGPTPSSAVFYGALSVHLGAFLLLRMGPILKQSWLLCAIVVIVGLLTAVFAAFAGRVQTDIKGALSFASLTQVGIIVAEIGLGLRYVALVHIIGHACLRTLQFLRAPSLLYDYRVMENAIGARLPRAAGSWQRMISPRLRTWFYRLALEKGYLDAWLTDYLVAPFLVVLRWCDAVEHRWTDFLGGGPSRPSQQPPPPGSLEDLV